MEVVVAAGAAVATGAINVGTTAATNSISRIVNFEDNLGSLNTKMRELIALRNDVEKRINAAENDSLTRTDVVSQWLDRVSETNQLVILIVQQGSRQIEQRCGIVGCYPNSWWACYRLGKKVSKMLITVEELISKCNFVDVANVSLPSLVQVLHETKTVGLDELFKKVWEMLGDDEVMIMGIYGMGGVGKTTLLKKLNNAFRNEVDRFDVVIWVVVSKEFRIKNVQKQIGKRLGFELREWEDEAENAVRIFNALLKKKFVVMFDDIWAQIKLGEIGIPSSSDTLNKSKLVFTTRSEDVCGSMACDRRVPVPVLDSDKSWELFQQNVGQEALGSHSEVAKIAKEVAKECCGLPLALITIGRAMTTKKTPPEWKHAIKTLRNNAAEFSGMGHDVLSTLKFSYDNLKNDTVERCFTYFALYPEDHNVSKTDIIYEWIGEGFLDDCEDMDAAIYKGHYIIGVLKAACLLEIGEDEESEVKLHDVIRDLALWIARECGKKKDKFLVVQAGVGSTQAPNIECWTNAERISLMDNYISELPDEPNCPLLQTLFLQHTWRLSRFPTAFFQHMRLLRVLNLFNCSITELPKSIGGLLALRFLDLREVRIKTLPQELGDLVELRYLNLHFTPRLEYIPSLSRCSKLQFLDFFNSGCEVKGKISHPCVKDLENMGDLRELGLNITEIQMLTQKLSLCITKLRIFRCKDLTKLALASSSSIFRDLKKICQLRIQDCVEMEELEINSVPEVENMEWLESLEILALITLPKLNISWRKTCTLMQFKNLSSVTIGGCDLLKDLSWLFLVPSLKVLWVGNCLQLEDIILVESAIDNQTIFTRLESLYMQHLPKLKSISRLEELPFPSLRNITASGCPLLKKLPFSSTSTKKPLFWIRGSREWWNALQWEDQTAKSSFQPFFQLWG